MLQERYQKVALNAEEIVDDLLKTSSPDLTKSKALDLLRKKLFSLHNAQYGIMISEVRIYFLPALVEFLKLGSNEVKLCGYIDH